MFYQFEIMGFFVVVFAFFNFLGFYLDNYFSMIWMIDDSALR